MDKIRSEVIFTLKSWEQTTEPNHIGNIRSTRTIWLEYNKFLDYIKLDSKDRVQFLLDNNVNDFDF